MITYYDSTVFNSGAQTIVNTVNTVGFMGKGLALEFSLRYPAMAQYYADRCKKKLLRVGKVDYYHAKEQIIVNFPTKTDFKYPSRIKWIEDGLKDFLDTYKQAGVTSVAFPKLGCSNGGLTWDEVRRLMETYLSKAEIDVFICLDIDPEPRGKEKEMVECFNELNIDDVAKLIRLSQKSIFSLNQARPIKRFNQIQKLDGVGQKTYAALFGLCYNYDSLPVNKQLALF